MPPALKKVSKLTITFLVDNSIEWMTKLPPGFSHEILYHIKHTAVDPSTGVPVLNFNDFCCGAHGFAALLETELSAPDDDSEGGMLNEEAPQSVTTAKHWTLFDTGPDAQSLVRNIRGLQVPITQIDRVVTSHWHSDHTGGLLSFLKLRNECVEQGVTTPKRNSELPPSTTSDSGGHSSAPPSVVATPNPGPCIVDVHPSRPLLRGIAPPPTHDVICALPPDPTFDEITALGGVLEKNDKGHTVAGETVWISGEIPRVTDFEGGLLSGVRWMEGEGVEPSNGKFGRWVPEPHIMDERYAAVDVEGKGLVIFSSCSHAGIVNVVKDAVKTFSRPVHMIVGGLHLASSDLYPRIEPTVDFFCKELDPPPTYILPMHCTGWRAKLALEKALGDGIVPAGVGHKVEV